MVYQVDSNDFRHLKVMDPGRKVGGAIDYTQIRTTYLEMSLCIYINLYYIYIVVCVYISRNILQ